MWEYSEEALKIMVKLFVDKLRERVAAKDYPYGNPERGQSNKIASGQLYNSITGDVEIDEQGNPVAVLEYVDYFKFVNQGRQPYTKRVPLNALLEWIDIRGLKGRNRDRRGRFRSMSNLELAWAIQTNIFKYGIRPTDIYDRGLDDLENMFADFPNNLPSNLRGAAENILEEAARDIAAFIDNQVIIEKITITDEE